MSKKIEPTNNLADFQALLDIELRKIINAPSKKLKKILKAKREAKKFIRQAHR